jgi:hypothetical protein
MEGMGMALMGTGVAKGEHRAMEAAQRAISSPLLEEASIDGAKGVLINITGGSDLTLFEVSEAATYIQQCASEDANIIFGTVIDDNIQEEVKITVIATGFDKVHREAATPFRGHSSSYPHRGAERAAFKSTPTEARSPRPQREIKLPTEIDEIPALKRAAVPVVQQQAVAVSGGGGGVVVPPVAGFGADGSGFGPKYKDGADDQYDVPTFLRKQFD